MLGMLKRYTVELCPEVQGRLTHSNTPITNQIIERSLTYADEELIDTCTTDNNGEFYFPEKSIKSRLPGSIFHEARIRQIIFIKNDSVRYLWLYTQGDIVTPKFIIDKITYLNADLNNKENIYEVDIKNELHSPFLFKSLCKW